MNDRLNSKEVTNEELARMIAKGFSDTATKSDINKLDKGLDDVEGRLDIVENKLDKALYHEFERVNKLEKQMEVVYQKLGLPETA